MNDENTGMKILCVKSLSSSLETVRLAYYDNLRREISHHSIVLPSKVRSTRAQFIRNFPVKGFHINYGILHDLAKLWKKSRITEVEVLRVDNEKLVFTYSKGTVMRGQITLYQQVNELGESLR